jgi:hypothetical protein
MMCVCPAISTLAVLGLLLYNVDVSSEEVMLGVGIAMWVPSVAVLALYYVLNSLFPGVWQCPAFVQPSHFLAHQASALHAHMNPDGVGDVPSSPASEYGTPSATKPASQCAPYPLHLQLVCYALLGCGLVGATGVSASELASAGILALSLALAHRGFFRLRGDTTVRLVALLLLAGGVGVAAIGHARILMAVDGAVLILMVIGHAWVSGIIDPLKAVIVGDESPSAMSWTWARKGELVFLVICTGAGIAGRSSCGIVAARFELRVPHVGWCSSMLLTISFASHLQA